LFIFSRQNENETFRADITVLAQINIGSQIYGIIMYQINLVKHFGVAGFFKHIFII